MSATTDTTNDFAANGWLVVGHGQTAVLFALAGVGLTHADPFELDGRKWEFEHFSGCAEECDCDDLNAGACDCIKFEFGELETFRPAELSSEEFDRVHHSTDYMYQDLSGDFVTLAEVETARAKFPR